VAITLTSERSDELTSEQGDDLIRNEDFPLDGEPCVRMSMNKHPVGDIVSLRDYVDTRLCAIEHTIKVSNEQINYRLTNMNKFREKFDILTSTLVSKQEFNDCIKSLHSDVENLKLFQAELKGKASQASVNIANAIAITGLVIGLLSLLLKLYGQ